MKQIPKTDDCVSKIYLLDDQYFIRHSPDNDNELIEKDGIFSVFAVLDFSLIPQSQHYPVLKVRATNKNDSLIADIVIISFNDIRVIVESNNKQLAAAFQQAAIWYIQDHYYDIVEQFKKKHIHKYRICFSPSII